MIHRAVKSFLSRVGGWVTFFFFFPIPFFFLALLSPSLPAATQIRGHIVGPVANQVILEPGIGQFREFESPRVHTRINS